MDPTAATGGLNPIDIAAVAIVAFTFVFGLRSGFFPQLGGLVGAIAGAWVTLLVLPVVRDQLVTMDPPLRAFIIIGALIIVVGIGEAAGSAIGSAIRERLGPGILGNADRLAGAFLGVGQGLLVIWLAGGLLAAGPVPGAAAWAQTSTAVRTLSFLLPPPTEIATSLGHLLDASGLPQLFVGLEPFPASPVDTPTTAAARRIAANAIASTVKVSTVACSFDLTGTGFSVGHGYYVTNAHVVAGGTREQVSTDGGTPARATVVLFDPTLDIALLYAPNLSTPPLLFAAKDPPRGATAAALGHPFGEPLVVIPVGVASEYPAQGLDIYGEATVTRQILELSARIDKGDSGGPVVLEDGTVGGVVFAESKNDSAVGYALSATAVAKRIAVSMARTTAISTGPCVH